MMTVSAFSNFSPDVWLAFNTFTRNLCAAAGMDSIAKRKLMPSEQVPLSTESNCCLVDISFHQLGNEAPTCAGSFPLSFIVAKKALDEPAINETVALAPTAPAFQAMLRQDDLGAGCGRRSASTLSFAASNAYVGVLVSASEVVGGGGRLFTIVTVVGFVSLSAFAVTLIKSS